MAETHPDVQAYMRAIEAFNANDLEAAARVVGEDIVCTIHGQNVLAGTYTGLGGFAGLLAKAKRLTDDTASLELKVVLADDETVMVRARFTAVREGRRADYDHVYVYRFDSGRLVEGHTIPLDQSLSDKFWGKGSSADD